jgi:hypothetical protein
MRSVLLTLLATVLFGSGPATAAQQTVNVGSAPSDGTGDTLRNAFGKVNSNFRELYADQGIGYGRLNATLTRLATNTVYAAGPVTYSSGTYTAAAGAQPLPSQLAAGQVYFVRFNQANPGAANLTVGTLPTKAIKVLDSAGTALTLAGGEIVPGPATVYYDGSQFIYQNPGPRVVAVTGPLTLTQASFTAHDSFYIAGGDQTLTLPCAATLSPNGGVSVFSTSGTLTISRGGSCSSDALVKNGASGTSTTIAQGAALALIVTDGAGSFYVSGS